MSLACILSLQSLFTASFPPSELLCKFYFQHTFQYNKAHAAQTIAIAIANLPHTWRSSSPNLEDVPDPCAKTSSCWPFSVVGLGVGKSVVELACALFVVTIPALERCGLGFGIFVAVPAPLNPPTEYIAPARPGLDDNDESDDVDAVEVVLDVEAEGL
jgi:hypothetical protein